MNFGVPNEVRDLERRVGLTPAGVLALVQAGHTVLVEKEAGADSVGPLIFSAVGGQVDFIRGAARSRGGLPIIAFLSTAKNGTVSRIVPMLYEGSGVVTTRNDVHYVVTEYGVASLYGKSVRERARELINIAHPKFRDELTSSARDLGY